MKGKAASIASGKATASAKAGDVASTIAELQAAGSTSLAALAKALTDRGVPTAKGASTWSPMQVSRVLKQVGA